MAQHDDELLPDDAPVEDSSDDGDDSHDRSASSSGAHTSAYTSQTCRLTNDSGGDGTQMMKTMLQHTLETYPPHYQAALRTIMEHPASEGHFDCVGAMETGLSEDGMTVAFDFRRAEPWARLIINVTMSFGQVTDVKVKPLMYGEHSGIQNFEQSC